MRIRRMNLTLALLVSLVAILLISTAGRAGLMDSIKQKVTKKTTEATDKAAQDAAKGATAKPATTDASGEAGQTPAPATGGAPDGGKVSAVSTKFDFVPGDSVMFFDDFTQDELGEFPAKWKLVQGNFEVAEMEGERWLRCTSPDAHIQMKAPASLPEFWTLEFDLYEKEIPTNFTLTVTALSKTGNEIWKMHYPYGGDLAFRCGEIFSQTPLEGSPKNGRHHFMLSGARAGAQGLHGASAHGERARRDRARHGRHVRLSAVRERSADDHQGALRRRAAPAQGHAGRGQARHARHSASTPARTWCCPNRLRCCGRWRPTWNRTPP